jgi:hypothetical protein
MCFSVYASLERPPHSTDGQPNNNNNDNKTDINNINNLGPDEVARPVRMSGGRGPELN